jgi:hypothetical protein
MTMWLNQEADGVYHATDVRVLLETVSRTPPQVDASLCRNAQRNAVFLWTVKSRAETARLIAVAPSIGLLPCEQTFSLLSPVLMDVQMYFCPVDRGRSCRQRQAFRLVLEALGRSVSQGDQQKDKRPGPTKPPGPETEKPPPRREGDKGKRKEKSPRTEGGLAPFLSAAEEG